MKNFLKTLNLLIFIVTLANCSKSKFDELGEYNNPMAGAEEVTYEDPDHNDIIISRAVNNIYIVIDRRCVKGLASNADDPIVDGKNQRAF